MHSVSQQMMGKMIGEWDAILESADKRIGELNKEIESLKAELESLKPKAPESK